jgi:hypothetical protein
VDDPFSVDRLNGVGDYHVDWDIPTLGKQFTDAFSTAINDVRLHPQLDPKRKIQAFIGQAGYGKTHLFGRLRHIHENRVYFSFIAAPPGLEGDQKELKLETTLRWQLVESLLYSSDSCAPFRVELARLLIPSFMAYLDQLSPALRARCASVRNSLEEADAHWAVLGFFGPVETLTPYHQLADAIQSALPHCSGPAVRALVMSVSEAGDDVRRWLRGEAEQMSYERLAELKLLDRNGQPLASPPLIEILFAVAELLRLNKIPLVVCFDQLEELFKNDRAGFTALTGQLMSWLQRVPNLLLGLGCMEDVWKELRVAEGFKSFFDRVTAHVLPPLSGAEAVELVVRRMRSWTDFDPKQPHGWPFELDSVRDYAEKLSPPTRGFIQAVCAPRFNEWLTRNRQGTIKLGGSKEQEESLADLFKQEWGRTLQSVQAEKKPPSDIQLHFRGS